jgi:transformation/transcription domain-associated protein
LSSPQASSTACNKEEKDTIESLGLIFSLLHPLTLKEIFTLTVDYLIEHTFKNANISIISSYFLATPATSFTYATILIEYLLNKMELMGCKYFIYQKYF